MTLYPTKDGKRKIANKIMEVTGDAMFEDMAHSLTDQDNPTWIKNSKRVFENPIFLYKKAKNQFYSFWWPIFVYEFFFDFWGAFEKTRFLRGSPPLNFAREFCNFPANNRAKASGILDGFTCFFKTFSPLNRILEVPKSQNFLPAAGKAHSRRTPPPIPLLGRRRNPRSAPKIFNHRHPVFRRPMDQGLRK